jgi:uroporphyrinogen decarboxylase
MRYQTVDHPPIVVPGPWDVTRKRWEKEGLPEGVDLRDYFDLAPYEGFQHVGFETVLCPPFEEEILERTEEYIIKIDHNGVKVKNFPEEDSMPVHLEYPIKGRESLPWLREKLDPETPDRLDPDWLEKAHEAREDGIVFCNGGMYFGFLNERMGTEKLLMTYYDDPDFIHEVNELQCRCCEKGLNTVLPHFQLDTIGYHEDMAYKNASMISPELFKEFMSPYYGRIQKIARQYDIDLQWLDSDGNIWELIPLWLEFGINILLPMEVAAGMDVVELRKEFGQELRMIGGFDKRIMSSSRKEDIKDELERLRPVIEDGGYVPALDHGAPPDIPFENVCYYIDCLKTMFGMD